MSEGIMVSARFSFSFTSLTLPSCKLLSDLWWQGSLVWAWHRLLCINIYTMTLITIMWRKA